MKDDTKLKNSLNCDAAQWLLVSDGALEEFTFLFVTTRNF